MRHSMLLLFGGMLALQGCAPNWQPSWNTSGNAALPKVDSLTVRRVTTGDTTAEVLRTESLDYEAMRAPATPTTQMTPDDAMRLPPPPPPPRMSSSTPPPMASVPPRAPSPPATTPAAMPAPPPPRVEGTVIPATPGQPAGIVAGGNDRTQVFNQPGTAGGGIAVRDGGTTTIIGPGGRITSVPTQR
ncbi:MAG: hypothetical protein INF79_07145 [Roseomonas sp.]|nr:hypothetical protein [Roseomonas sp.]MCA3333059.1 hypothetical protein [Roseomonas sp.]MCA3335868.1 hypothetical protein [Roseomonas sp.]MCA3356088.1 hypothetical protein [Roseomonas sp.]MCA3361780.1 hypothetical protein [Roseomonas sp.]